MTNITELFDIPATIRALRASLDLTQEQLAERLGVSFATVNRWEGGASKPQKAAREAIAALAADIGIDVGTVAAESGEAAAGVTRRRRGKRTPTPSTKTMEQMLWDAACSIRGEKDAAKFKDYLLPLLFLKRLSDVFDDEIERLGEEYGDRDIALEIAESDPISCASICRPKPVGASSAAARSTTGSLTARAGEHAPGTSESALQWPCAPWSGTIHPFPASLTWSTSQLNATVNVTSIRPDLPPSWRPSPIRAIESGSPMFSRTFWAALTSFYCASLLRAPARAPVSSSRRPRSVF